jgi:hypothetical protein
MISNLESATKTWVEVNQPIDGMADVLGRLKQETCGVGEIEGAGCQIYYRLLPSVLAIPFQSTRRGGREKQGNILATI